MRWMILVLCLGLVLSCTSTTINIPPGTNVGNITINANKNVNTSPSLDARARDVQVPLTP